MRAINTSIAWVTLIALFIGCIILPACTTMGALEEGMDIYQRVGENGFPLTLMVVNSLIGMHAKCERIHQVWELFNKMHDAYTVSWERDIQHLYLIVLIMEVRQHNI